jgi:hypothetical protein
MVWELGLDAKNPEEAVSPARAIRQTPSELSGSQLLGVRTRVLQLQCDPILGRASGGLGRSLPSLIKRP